MEIHRRIYALIAIHYEHSLEEIRLGMRLSYPTSVGTVIALRHIARLRSDVSQMASIREECPADTSFTLEDDLSNLGVALDGLAQVHMMDNPNSTDRATGKIFHSFAHGSVKVLHDWSHTNKDR